jgi:hypothetical protein
MRVKSIIILKDGPIAKFGIRFQGNGTEAYVPIQLNPFEDVTELIHKVRNTTPPSREVKHPIDKRV